MKPSDKDKSGGTSFWGVFLSISLHAVILMLVLFWGFSGTSRNTNSSGPIEVSLSGLGPGGGRNANPESGRKTPPQEPVAVEPPKVETKKEVEEVPPEPKQKEQPKEPAKKEVKKVEVKQQEPKEEEKPKKVVKKEPEKKEVIPLETEKKEVKKKEEHKKEIKKELKKEEKKEVAEKPKATEKPKTETKKTTVSNVKKLESEKNKVLQDLKRQRIIEELKNSSQEGSQPQEEFGEERRLAMADNGELPEGSREGPGDSSVGSRSRGGGSSINPVLLQLYTDKVHQRISRNWRIPPGVPTDGNLEAGLFFRVDQNGRVFDVRVNRSSGNSAFDEYCVSAIYKSAPLPPPPSEFAKEALNDGITVSFKNEPF
jgi:TolA protein